MPSPRERRLQRQYDQDIAQTGAAGEALTRGFTRGVGAFDPQAALERRLASAHSRFKERLGEDVRNMRAAHVGMGRLDTGFATEDEDRVFRQSAYDMNRLSGDLAMRAADQDLRRLSMMGAYGDRMTDRAMSARGGEYHTLRSQRLQDRADRRRGWRNLFSAGLGAVGTILGGPIGGALASRIGGGRR